MKKILIIRFSSIGDIVLTTPVIRCLKQKFPDTEIHFLVKKQFAPTVEANPNIDKLHIYNYNLPEILQELRAEKFDYIVDLQRSLRSKIVLLALHKPFSYFPKLNYQKWMLVHFKTDKLPDVHIVSRYFEAVKNLQVVDDKKGLDYFIPENQEISQRDLPEGYWNRYAVLVVGGSFSTKQIPTKKALEICKIMNQPIVIAGGKNDWLVGNEISSLLKGMIFNACGKFSLNQSASLIKNAQCVITSDTGLMHIAAAFHQPIVSLWGNTVPKFGMYPYMPETPERSLMLEVSNLKCRPCSKLGFKKCPKKHFRCMNDISLQDIEPFIQKYQQKISAE
ncbi:MAG: glycosyltransferase family 9 protein [Bacteroidales bacterium]|nr:glycosyltransferase family 9 protein [Bacteroidales bacterium]